MKRKNKRKSIRIKDYDYSENGAYFITICTKDRKNILSDINTNIEKNIAIYIKCGIIIAYKSCNNKPLIQSKQTGGKLWTEKNLIL